MFVPKGQRKYGVGVESGSWEREMFGDWNLKVYLERKRKQKMVGRHVCVL